MTESEKRVWKDYLEKNPLEWTEENNFGEDKDHTPVLPQESAAASGADGLEGETTSNAVANDEEGGDKEPEVAAVKPGEGSPDKQRQDGEQPLPGVDAAHLVDDSGSIPLTPHQMTVPSPSKTGLACKVCGRPGRRCAGCMLVAYCGKEHQLQDWKKHKTLCEGKTNAGFTVSSPSKTDFACRVCGQPGKRCVSCMLVAYCGKEHQLQDWKNHKTLCKGKKRADFTAPTPSKTDLACNVCGQPGKRCVSCMLVAYCGKEHQLQDWKKHKTLCKGKKRAG